MGLTYMNTRYLPQYDKINDMRRRLSILKLPQKYIEHMCVLEFIVLIFIASDYFDVDNF